MPGPRDIPGGEPERPRARAGPRAAGRSRSLRHSDEFALIYRIGTYVITPVRRRSGRAVSGGWSSIRPRRRRATRTRRSARDSSRRGSRTIVTEVTRMAEQRSSTKRSSWFVRWALEAPSRWLGRKSRHRPGRHRRRRRPVVPAPPRARQPAAPARRVRRRSARVAAGAADPRLPRHARLDVHARAPARRGRLRRRRRSTSARSTSATSGARRS